MGDTKQPQKMLSAIYFAHLLTIIGTANVDILLSFESVQQNIPETAIKVNLNSGDDFFEDVGLC